MAKIVTCYFSLTSGLQGCYMPDAHWGAFAVTRRKDLIGAVHDTLNILLDQEGDRPVARCLREVNWTKLWSQPSAMERPAFTSALPQVSTTCSNFTA